MISPTRAPADEDQLRLDVEGDVQNDAADDRSGATTHTTGVRNWRSRSGSLMRSTITASATIAKANSVPEFE